MQMLLLDTYTDVKAIRRNSTTVGTTSVTKFTKTVLRERRLNFKTQCVHESPSQRNNKTSSSVAPLISIIRVIKRLFHIRQESVSEFCASRVSHEKVKTKATRPAKEDFRRSFTSLRKVRTKKCKSEVSLCILPCSVAHVHQESCHKAPRPAPLDAVAKLQRLPDCTVRPMF